MELSNQSPVKFWVNVQVIFARLLMTSTFRTARCEIRMPGGVAGEGQPLPMPIDEKHDPGAYELGGALVVIPVENLAESPGQGGPGWIERLIGRHLPKTGHL